MSGSTQLHHWIDILAVFLCPFHISASLNWKTSLTPSNIFSPRASWWVFPRNRGFCSPQIIHLKNRVFHCFHHPFWGIPIFGNTHLFFTNDFAECEAMLLRDFQGRAEKMGREPGHGQMLQGNSGAELPTNCRNRKSIKTIHPLQWNLNFMQLS